MTSSYGSERTIQQFGQIHYRGQDGKPIPIADENKPHAQDNLQFEVEGLRLINAWQRERIAQLEARIAELTSSPTYPTCSP